MSVLSYIKEKLFGLPMVNHEPGTYLRDIIITCTKCSARFRTYYIWQKHNNKPHPVCCPLCNKEHMVNAVSPMDQRLVTVVSAGKN